MVQKRRERREVGPQSETSHVRKKPHQELRHLASLGQRSGLHANISDLSLSPLIPLELERSYAIISFDSN
jgi:hypothetical protein